MAKLVIVKGGAPTTHQLCAKTTLLGRREDCELVLMAHGVSRQHARVINQDEETYVLEDLDSANGTYVNGTRLATPYVLKDQDRIRVGSFLIRFEEETPAQPSLPQSGKQSVSEDEDCQAEAATAMPGLLTKEGEKKLTTLIFPTLPPDEKDD